MLFASHKKRLSGEPPVDANKGPEALQKEFDDGLGVCDSTDVLEELHKMIVDNPCLQTGENSVALNELEKKMDFLA